MSEHTWFNENLPTYNTGGLSAEERERFERHRIACGPCAKLLAEFSHWDGGLLELFACTQPAPGWENQVVKKLRLAPRWRIRPWLRMATAAAAVLFLGAVGAILNNFLAEGDLVFPGSVKMDQEVLQRDQDVPEFAFAGRIKESREEKSSPDGKRLAAHAGVESPPGMDLWSDRGLGRSPANAEGRVSGVGNGRTHERFVPVEGQLALGDSLEVENTDLRLRVALMDGTASTLGYKAGDGLTFFSDIATESGSNKSAAPAFTPPVNMPAQAGFGYDTAMGLGVGNKTSDAPPSSPPEKMNLPVLAGASVPGSFYGRSGSTQKQSRVRVADEKLVEKGNRADLVVEKAEAVQDKQNPPEPLVDAASRKIIRTGEIDYEVDRFDAAVADITKLVDGIKGAFILTINSTKLENGKVRGSVVVRLPPENLNKFLLDLRQELAKVGELKNQRIGSQDVTKQYTDTASRLRAARAMEERFLQIIKTGKGEVKDLIVAEKALGDVRTKIEEMEGEIRYYNHQIALSTLTVNLVEKEIQAPAALVVTEQVKMQIEVDDVDKAQQSARDAVRDLKGRVTKAEVKQFGAGQYQAELRFEVAPAEAPKLRDRLKLLGLVTRLDVDRTQQTQGNQAKLANSAAGIKVKLSDVQFEVGLYNLAGLQPRDVLVIRVAAADVPFGFRKIQDAAVKAGAKVLQAQLAETDKFNMSATLNFDVLTQDKKAIETALGEAGKIQSRNATQAPPNEKSTDRKIGYRLTIIDAASLTPREQIGLGIEVRDVSQTITAITDMVKARKGRILAATTNQERSGRVSARMQFDVPLAVKDDVASQLKSMGAVRSQTGTTNSQAPDNDLSTARFDVVLANANPIVPNDEGLWPQIRTSLFYTFKALSWSLMFVILGISVALPWLLILWIGFKVYKRLRKKPAQA